jgi:GNAT superfamily N-acetyltransferase
VSQDVQLRPARPDELDLLREIDDATGAMYLAAGVDLSSLSLDHPYVQAEQADWRRALHDGRAYVAQLAGQVVGFSVLDMVDGAPYLEQLSVRPQFMRRGIGTTLLHHALRASVPAAALWLTTYAHLPWNAPYYQSRGFSLVPDTECGPRMLEILAEQRQALPLPEKRVAMVFRVGP